MSTDRDDLYALTQRISQMACEHAPDHPYHGKSLVERGLEQLDAIETKLKSLKEKATS